MIKKIILNKLILPAFINIFVYYIFCLKALTYAFYALVFLLYLEFIFQMNLYLWNE